MLNLAATILIIGDEITSGDLVDTNTGFLATELRTLGLEIERIVTVGDYEEKIVAALAEAQKNSSLVITTGGLGPTTDDLTREAIASFAKVPLEINEDSLRRLHERFRKRNRTFHKINERQAFFPKGATILPNAVGTADAFITTVSELPIVTLPGVPSELKRIYFDSVREFVEKRYPDAPRRKQTMFKCFGLPEALVGTFVEKCNLPSSIRVSYRPVFPEIWVKFVGSDQASVDAASRQVQEAIGLDSILATDPKVTFATIVGNLLREKKKTVAVAESCSGGALSDLFCSVPGASDYFLAGVVNYSNSAKTSFVGVQRETLEKHGAVSEQTAIELARGVRERAGSDFGLSITGIAGPNGGTQEKPVGTAWIGFSRGTQTDAYRLFFPTDRNRFRLMCAFYALDFVRRELEGFSLPVKGNNVEFR